jgi:hypothetical protein
VQVSNLFSQNQPYKCPHRSQTGSYHSMWRIIVTILISADISPHIVASIKARNDCHNIFLYLLSFQMPGVKVLYNLDVVCSVHAYSTDEWTCATCPGSARAMSRARDRGYGWAWEELNYQVTPRKYTPGNYLKSGNILFPKTNKFNIYVLYFML